MVDFREKKRGSSFSLGRTDRPPPLRQREKIRMLVLVGVTILFVLVLVDFVVGDDERLEAEDAAPVVGLERDPVEAMQLVAFDEVPAWPGPEEIADQDEAGAHLFEHPEEVRAYAEPFDAMTMAWLERQLPRDQERPPLPQAQSGVDLVRGRVKHGKATLISGTLVDMRELTVREAGDWLRLEILLPNPDEIPLLALVDAPRSALREGGSDLLSPGREVQVVGRYLGMANVETVEGREQSVPVLAGYSVRQHDGAGLLEVLRLGRNEERGRVWKRDPTIYQEIDDFYDSNPRMSHLERRPYYYMLGRVHLDASTPGVYADARSLDQWSNEVYRTPGRFRGEVFTVEGEVIAAWVDQQATQDQPFGVNRVIRMWMFDVVYGIGAQPFRTVYEVAVVVSEDRALPEEGDYVRLTGRFLKMLTYYEPNSQMQAMVDPENTDNEYTMFKFLVAPDFEVVPPAPPPEYFWFKLASLVVMGSFLLFMVALMLMEDRHGDDYKQKMHRLRANRRRLAREKRAGSAADEGADAPTRDEN